MLHSYHNHTYRCNHASGSEREYIEAAVAAGIKTIGFADHVPMPFEGEYYSRFRMKLHDTEDYIKTLEALRDEYKNDIEVHIGFEAEYYPAVFPRMMDFISDYPYEYLILGQHALGNEQNDHYCSRKTADRSLLKRYVDQVTEGVSTGEFLYIAHPDILNFIGDYEYYESEMSRLCEFAKGRNIPLEINIHGLREGRNYPNTEFWRLAAKTGCYAVIGADAHCAQHVFDAEYIRMAEELANMLGIKIIDSLEDRLRK